MGLSLSWGLLASFPSEIVFMCNQFVFILVVIFPELYNLEIKMITMIKMIIIITII